MTVFNMWLFWNIFFSTEAGSQESKHTEVCQRISDTGDEQRQWGERGHPSGRRKPSKVSQRIKKKLSEQIND